MSETTKRVLQRELFQRFEAPALNVVFARYRQPDTEPRGDPLLMAERIAELTSCSLDEAHRGIRAAFEIYDNPRDVQTLVDEFIGCFVVPTLR